MLAYSLLGTNKKRTTKAVLREPLLSYVLQKNSPCSMFDTSNCFNNIDYQTAMHPRTLLFKKENKKKTPVTKYRPLIIMGMVFVIGCLFSLLILTILFLSGHAQDETLKEFVLSGTIMFCLAHICIMLDCVMLRKLDGDIAHIEKDTSNIHFHPHESN